MSKDIFLHKLRGLFKPQQLILDEEQKKPFETDWRKRYFNQALAIVLPNNVTEIVNLINLCQKHNIAIVPQGGNTSLCGGSIPIDTGHEIIVNFRNLNKIIELDVVNQTITVEAGCTLQQIIDFAASHNLYFPLSIASQGSCQIGGNIATNAGGIHVVQYGMMRDLVMGLEVVLSSGQTLNQLNALHKNNINFDLKQLFIGSEGTLGIITKAVLKLFPIPENYFTALIGINTLEQTIKLFKDLKQKFKLVAFEIIDQNTQTIYNEFFSQAKLPVEGNWLILLELETFNEFIPNNFVNILEQNEIDINNANIASNESERSYLWHIRENIPLAEKMSGVAIKHDIALPISQIATFIALNEKNILNKFPDATIIKFGHLGDGNLHYNIQFKQRNMEEFKRIEEQVNQIVYNDVMHYAGSYSAEHGIGQLKKQWFATYYDTNSYNLAKQIKQLVDPNNLFNPHKIFSEITKPGTDIQD